MPTKSRLFLSTLILSLPLSGAALAENGSFESPTHLAMGHTGVASPGNAAIFENPAALGVGPAYQFEMGYQMSGKADSHAFGAAVADSQTNSAIAGGVAWSYVTGRGPTSSDDDNIRGQHARTALALPLVENMISLGFGLERFNYRLGNEPDTEVFNPVTGEMETVAGDEIQDQAWAMDAGIALRAGDTASAGFAIRNLKENETFGRTREYVAGFTLTPQRSFRLQAEWEGHERIGEGGLDHGFGVGARYSSESGSAMMVGYELTPEALQHRVGGGLELGNQKGGLSVAYQQSVGNRDYRQLIIGLNMFL